MLHHARNNMKLYLIEDAVQNIESDYCGVFGLYFYNLLGPNNKAIYWTTTIFQKHCSDIAK